ncbi:MAG: hypothetical protein AAFO17_05230 [Pseudomonadota bacterium]
MGLDVSLRTVAVCVNKASGKHVFERSVAWEIEEIVGRPSDVPQGQCRIGLADPVNVCFVPARLRVAA